MIDSRDINSLIRIFEKSSHNYDPRGIHKLENPWLVDGVKDILTPTLNKVGIDTSVCFGDNFYKHNYEYLIHTDFREADGESINVVIPLKKDPHDQYLIVFDQSWGTDGRTWARDSKKIYKPNTGLPGRPFDYNNVHGLTNHDIEDSLFAYLKDIPHMPREYFFGLTGKAHKWEPGNILQFNSKLLHCTAKMKTKWKVGLLLRFKT